MPQYPPYPPIFTQRGQQRGRYPGAQYPQQGQIPIFTPPIVAPGGVTSGMPTAGGSNAPYYEQMPQGAPSPNPQMQPSMTMPDGSPVQPQDNVRQMTREEQARFAPDQAPPGKGLQPEPKSGLRKFFDNLTSAPNASALLTAGSILSSAPHQGESPLGQAVRGINGAYSTLGLYAQQRAAQQEAQRKAGLEREQQNNKNLETVAGARKDIAGVGQKDRELDLKADENANTAEANKQKQADLAQNRKDRLEQHAKEIAQADKRIALLDSQLKQSASQHDDKMNMEGRKNQIQQERDKAVDDREWARIAIQKLRTDKDLDSTVYKDYDMAIKIAKQTAALGDIGADAAKKKQALDAAFEQVKAGKTGGATAPAATEGQTATNPQTGAKVVFKGGAWQPVP